jgi:hypothetical protein
MLPAALVQIAGGVRLDVPAVPCWVRQQVEQPMVQAGLLPRGYVDSAALNIYHDGTEGEAWQLTVVWHACTGEP